mgnify:CR=1 FL=1
MSKNKGFSSTSANRYSLALYELAEEANVLSKIEINVLSIINLIEKSKDFKNLIKDPTVSQNDLSNAIDAWYSTGNIAVGTMEGALGLTLDPAASFIASTVANGNDLWRAINGLPFSPEIHNQIATDMQEHIIGATMAYWESTGYGAMRTATGKIPSMSATANFVSKQALSKIEKAGGKVNLIKKVMSIRILQVQLLKMLNLGQNTKLELLKILTLSIQ